MTNARPSPVSSDHWALNTTVRCQHRCVYCFEGDRHGHADLPAEEARRLIDRAAEVVPSVIFMGAEPTLNPHLPDLVAHARSRGLRPNISTNAIRLADAAYLRRLLDAGLMNIELSFPYPDAAVFAAITRVRPDGFARLLRALENIEQVARDAEELFVNLNVVVSRFNFDRLEEVVALAEARLVETPFAVSFKRVIPRPDGDAREFLERVHVPLASLRRVLPAAAARVPARARPCFRDFPLCAIPGAEHLDTDLRYWLDGTSVSHNFEEQGRVEDMYPESAERVPHAWQWICDTCALDPVCLRRGQFQLGRSGAEHAPAPMFGAPPPALERLVRSRPRGRRALDAPPRPADAAHADVLRALRARLPDTEGWRPLETGLLEHGDPPTAERFRMRPSAEDAAAPIHAGGWAVTPLGGDPTTDAARRLRNALEALAPGAGAPAASAAHDDPASRALPDLLATRIAPRVRELLREGLKRDVAVGAVGATITWAPAGRASPYDARVDVASGPRAEGFLCGRLRILPARFVLDDPEGFAGIEALARALAELDREGALAAAAPPAPAFLDRAWKRYGDALLPRRRTEGSLVHGRVGPEEVRLELVTADGLRFDLVLVPARHGVSACASDGEIALQYGVPPRGARHPVVERVVAHYARRLGTTRARASP